MILGFKRVLHLATAFAVGLSLLINPASKATEPIAAIVPSSLTLANFVFNTAATYELSGYRVTGPSDRDLLIGIGLEAAPDGDYLSLTDTGLDPSYGFTSGPDQMSEFTQITFVGRLDDINSNLSNGFDYHSANGVWSNSIKITLSVTEDVPGVAYYPRDGHYYKVGHFINSGTANAFCEAPGSAADSYITSYSGIETLTRLSTGDAACTWAQANTLARSGSLKGRPGYLANITTSGENNFLQSKLQGALNVWIGGTDGGATGSSSWTQVSEPSFDYFSATTVSDSQLSGGVGTEGLWRFYDGPEKGRVFWRQKLGVSGDWTTWAAGQEYSGYDPGTESNISDSNQDVLIYSNWADSASSQREPNNSSSNQLVSNCGVGHSYCGEDNIVFNWNSPSGYWNDLNGNEASVPFYGYVIEYGDATPFTGSSKATSSISSAPNCYETSEFAGGKKVIKFSSISSCSWSKPSSVTTIEVVAVAGGGGGGSSCVGGGGGAGGFLHVIDNNFQATTISISVGRGGAGGAGTGCAGNRGENGENTVITMGNQTLTLYGGGGGGQIGPHDGYDGGSGGGGSGLTTNGGLGVDGQGRSGGKGLNASPGNPGGGGGGATSVGGDATATTGGAGGSGFTSNVSGADENFAGGGGGASDVTGGLGGQSCGGNGASRNDGIGSQIPASVATGYGCGGGGGDGNQEATAGSRGVMYISYVLVPPAPQNGGGVSAPSLPRLPDCSWTPEDLTEGQPIGERQLSAVFSVPGMVNFSIKSGYKPKAGEFEITATFTPLDSVNFTSISVVRKINVKPAEESATTAPSGGSVIRLGVIYFKSNEYFLDASDRKELAALAKVIKSVPVNKLIVEGNTDVMKGVDNNWLSKSRAKAVANYMKSQGIKPKLIKLWFGPSKPVVNKRDRASLALNRRVEILIAK